MKWKLLTICLLLSGNALAITGNGMINIQLTPSCSIENTSIHLGNYRPDSSNIITAPIKHECSNGVSYKVKVSDSSKMDGNIRHLPSVDVNNKDTFQYKLYKNQAKENWGSSDAEALLYTGTGSSATSQVYIETIPGQFITPGIYKDTLTLTLTY